MPSHRLSVSDRERISIHESSHAVIDRLLGFDVAGATIVAVNDVGGHVWANPLHDPTQHSGAASLRETETVCARALALRPELGELRGDEFGSWIAVALPAMISALAGYEGEKLWNDCRAVKAGSVLDYRGAKLRAETLVYDSQAPFSSPFLGRPQEVIG